MVQVRADQQQHRRRPSSRAARRAGSGAGRSGRSADRSPTDTTIIGTSCTRPTAPTATDECVSVVHLDEQRDQRDLAADLRDHLAGPQQPEVARRPQRRDVDRHAAGPARRARGGGSARDRSRDREHYRRARGCESRPVRSTFGAEPDLACTPRTTTETTRGMPIWRSDWATKPPISPPRRPKARSTSTTTSATAGACCSRTRRTSRRSARPSSARSPSSSPSSTSAT